MSIKDVWKDPVGAGIISGIVLAAIGWAVGKFASNPVFIWRQFPIPLWLIIIVACVLIGTAWKLLSQREVNIREAYNFEPKITLVSVSANMAPKGSTLTYPLKCSVFLRNDSKGCVDVMLSRYEKDKIPASLFRQGVLQIEVAGSGWIPTTNGADQIAVLPGQNFRAWIPIDEKQYSEDMVRGAMEHIGTTVFKVNGKEVRIKI